LRIGWAVHIDDMENSRVSRLTQSRIYDAYLGLYLPASFFILCKRYIALQNGT
jgi:hypothetical protein